MPAARTRLRNLSREMREQQERGPSPPTSVSQNPSNNETILGTTGIPSIAWRAGLAPDIALVSIIPAIVRRITPRVFASPFAASDGCATCKTTTRGSL